MKIIAGLIDRVLRADEDKEDEARWQRSPPRWKPSKPKSTR